MAQGLRLGGGMTPPTESLRDPSPRTGREAREQCRGSWRRAVAVAAWALAATGCGNAAVPDLPPFDPVEIPDPASVDAVVFLLGDGGATEAGRSPTLAALARDVEAWSSALGRDSAVSVVYPGDIVYPVGVRDRDHPDFETDSVRLWNQIELVAGPASRQHASLGLFLAGNHDWGNARGEAGVRRVENLARALERARTTGPKVTLLPGPGEPGPVIRDLRRNVRLVFVDTHWFLQARAPREKDAFFEALADALTGADDRQVIMVQHHPYRSAGPHDALLPGPEALGIPFLLKKTGTLVQDLDAPVYAEFRRRLRRTFVETGRPPLIFAGGHDHSLQVLRGEGPDDPAHILVSGAGSKLTPITDAPGMAYGASRPGYMTLVFRADDGVELFVVAGDPDHLSCTGPLLADDEVPACMRAGLDSLRVRFSATLVEGRDGDAVQPSGSGRAPTPWWIPPEERRDSMAPDSTAPAGARSGEGA